MVENRDMPPWDADPGYGPWSNDTSLSDDEIAAITRWAASGAPRGKSMFFSAELPDGSTRDLLGVSHYDFHWQTTYQLSEPIPLPAGTRVRVKASFDNSADNPENPDPTVDVIWGLESSDEMLNGLVDYVAADG